MAFNRFALCLQYYVCCFFSLVSYFIIWIANVAYFHFTLNDKKLQRQQFKDMIKKSKGPLIICANHLTYIDSAIIQYALASPWTYLRYPQSWSWNFPKKEHVESSKFFRFMCYLGKCILLPDRSKAKERKIVRSKIEYLLQKGQYIMVFPEGTRSASGRVNSQDFNYSVGELYQIVPHVKILCVYMRTDHQIAKSKFPPKGNPISISMKLMTPETRETGLRASREISRQIIKTLVEMEQEYFSSHLQTRQ